MAVTGILEVVLIRAEGIKGDEFMGLGYADPYAVITCGRKSSRGNTATDQGSNPVFNQTFHFNVESTVSEITVELYNENLLADTHLGTAKVPLAEVLKSGFVSATRYDVKRSFGRVQGDVQLKLKFNPNSKANTADYDIVNPYAGAPEVLYSGANQNPSNPSTYSSAGSFQMSQSGSTHYPPSSPPYSLTPSPSGSFSQSPSARYPPSGAPPYASSVTPQYSSAGTSPYPPTEYPLFSPMSAQHPLPPLGYPPQGFPPPGAPHYAIPPPAVYLPSADMSGHHPQHFRYHSRKEEELSRPHSGRWR